MDNQKLIDKIEAAWASFRASWEDLPAEQLALPGAVGDWSVKDILAHVTTWEAESLEQLPVIGRGERAPSYKALYGGIDAFNAQMTERKRSLPLDEVLQQLEATHRRLVDYIAAAPHAQFATKSRCYRRVGWDSFNHYPHHEQAIREWRTRMGF